MRIKDKTQFTLGIFNILLAIIGTIIFIIQRKIEKIPILIICFACGIIGIINGIETEAQRQKRKSELQAMAKMFGWNKDGDTK